MNFSDYIKRDIKQLQCKNVREYAKRKNVSYTVIYDILNNKYNNPSPLTAARICKWFNLEEIDFINLFNIKDEEYINKLRYYSTNKKQDQFIKKSIENMFCNYYDNAPKTNTVYKLKDIPSLDHFAYICKIVDTSENSIYDGNSYNAIGKYTKFTFDRINNDKDVPLFDEEYTISNSTTADFAIYFLPPRRIEKNSNKTYPDEKIRDFTTKLLNIITNPKSPKNNIFFTNSIAVYKEVVNYTMNYNFKCSNGAGVGILFSRYNYPLAFQCICPNDDLINSDTFSNEYR